MLCLSLFFASCLCHSSASAFPSTLRTLHSIFDSDSLYISRIFFVLIRQKNFSLLLVICLCVLYLCCISNILQFIPNFEHTHTHNVFNTLVETNRVRIVEQRAEQTNSKRNKASTKRKKCLCACVWGTSNGRDEAFK